MLNHVKMMPNTNIKENKTKLVTWLRKYNELKKETSIYDL